MKDKFFGVLINGHFAIASRGNGIKKYKTKERAIKENEWFKTRGYKVEVGEIVLKDVEEV